MSDRPTRHARSGVTRIADRRPGFFGIIVAMIAVFALLFAGASAAMASSNHNTPPDTSDQPCVDAPAYDVIVVDTPAGWQRYSWNGDWDSDEAPPFPDDRWQANVAGDPHGVGVEGAYFRSHGSSGGGDWFYLELVDAVKHVEHHDAVVCPPDYTVYTGHVDVTTTCDSGTGNGTASFAAGLDGDYPNPNGKTYANDMPLNDGSLATAFQKVTGLTAGTVVAGVIYSGDNMVAQGTATVKACEVTPPTTPPVVNPPVVNPPVVNPPVVNPPVVNPPVVNPPVVNPPKVTPPVVTPPVTTPRKFVYTP